MEAKFPARFLLRAILVAHHVGPQGASSAILSDLLEDVIVGIEEETEPSGEVINLHAASQTDIDIVKPIRKGESKFLHGGGAGLADVIAADGDGVPLRNVLAAELDDITHEPYMRFGWKDELILSVKLLEDVILNGAAQFLPVNALVGGVG